MILAFNQDSHRVNCPLWGNGFMKHLRTVKGYVLPGYTRKGVNLLVRRDEGRPLIYRTVDSDYLLTGREESRPLIY